MTYGERAGSREGDGLLAFNQRWTAKNPLTEARDRRRLGDTNINYDSHALTPMVPDMVKPMTPAMVAPLVRRMGETTIQQRTTYGSRSIWDNTPVAPMVGSTNILGDVEIDITDLLAEWERVGWRWDRKSSKLCAYLTTQGKTYIVKIPLAKLQRIFNKAVKENGGDSNYFRERTLDGFFKKLGRGLKKAVKSVGRSIKQGITAPVRFVKNPKKFVKDTAAHLKKVVKGVGKTVIKVASSPVFAGVMTAMAAIPPLTAIGGAGLAAYAAANAIKPAFNAIDKTIDVVDAAKGKRGAGRAIKALTSAVGVKADGVVGGFNRGLQNLPGPAQKMMVAALKSTDARQLSKKDRRQRRKRVAFRFMRKRGLLSRIA